MAQTSINVRMDEELKKSFEKELDKIYHVDVIQRLEKCPTCYCNLGEDITSEQYGFNKDNVKSFIGEVMAKEYE